MLLSVLMPLFNPSVRAILTMEARGVRPTASVMDLRTHWTDRLGWGKVVVKGRAWWRMDGYPRS